MSTPVFPDRLRVAVPCGCALGESPVWDWRSDTLFFVDIKAPAVWRWRPGSGEDARAIPLSEPVSFVRPTPDPNIVVVGLKSGIARLDLSTGEASHLVDPEPHEPGNRLNDADVGADGSLWFGSMHDDEHEPSGSFYHWSGAGLARFSESAVVTNGPAIDPVRRVAYTADTKAGRVFRHALDTNGAPGARADFVAFDEGEGHPDGITIDSEGHVWICHWGGARITRFDPDGAPVLVVPAPTAQVTKAAFGGPDLATLYVTTAAIGRDREIDLFAGHLLALEPGVTGLPAGLCRVHEVTPETPR